MKSAASRREISGSGKTLIGLLWSRIDPFDPLQVIVQPLIALFGCADDKAGCAAMGVLGAAFEERGLAVGEFTKDDVIRTKQS
jgi:hypothetical protein